MVKDVSAMANAAGGRIYYGLVEGKQTGVAENLDDGLAPDEVNADRIGNLLTGNIEPAISGMRIHRVTRTSGNNAFVIDIPQATSLAPHQSRLDQRYYRRHDRKVLSMYDHEIKDLMRRSDRPDLHGWLELISKADPDSFSITFVVENKSRVPVLYYSIDVMTSNSMQQVKALETGFTLTPSVSFEVMGGHFPGSAFSRTFVTPHALPIFKPRPYKLWEQSFYVPDGVKHAVAISMTAPDFYGYWSGFVDRTGPSIRAEVTLEHSGS